MRRDMRGTHEGPTLRAGGAAMAEAPEHDWIEAGFFVVSDGQFPDRLKQPLAATGVTVSTCIVESYPDEWALPWVETAEAPLREIRESLSLDETDFSELRRWVARALDCGQIGWPNVYFSLHSAREF